MGTSIWDWTQFYFSAKARKGEESSQVWKINATEVAQKQLDDLVWSKLKTKPLDDHKI